VSAKKLEKAFRAFAWGTCISQFERFVITVDDVEYVIRAVECYFAADDDDDITQEGMVHALVSLPVLLNQPAICVNYPYMVLYIAENASACANFNCSAINIICTPALQKRTGAPWTTRLMYFWYR
jgi:hypothetical protein